MCRPVRSLPSPPLRLDGRSSRTAPCKVGALAEDRRSGLPGFLANVHYLPDPATRNLSYDHFPPPLITGSRGSPLAP